jgi:hypothetical protein
MSNLKLQEENVWLQRNEVKFKVLNSVSLEIAVMRSLKAAYDFITLLY